VDTFDVSLLKAAAALFPGTRDFRTFMGNKAKLPPDVSTVKEMYRLDVAPGTPLLGAEYSSCCAHYTFWDITCQAKSFLYRQVMCILLSTDILFLTELENRNDLSKATKLNSMV
jgi:tRNA U38,U39,U40 pseudouridine synthase TruA